ncbi:ABC transporter ATP-binding protein [Microbacterium sp. ASV49]|uniref:ABC transporter ATP-binding protein n=1 Tax=Microbacterium candidum TaxID=3041922 RepID=A0ABT7MWF0_9MICO|nr:ABC transporter ATP-binding protein [Microbacterium sp. ASV49]MDL9978767.1 ABC transporter ATP-binding protein [Microbacterium sp. ASV49]
MTARNIGSNRSTPDGPGRIRPSHLEIRGVSMSYGRTRVLDDVDLAVPHAGITAVVGASGSGKTTLLRVIAGFERPAQGTVVLGDQTVAGPAAWTPAHRRGVGYVTQDGGLFPHLSVARNIRFGLPRADRTGRDRLRARVDELLDLVALPRSVADRRPDQLSGGQQQRVAIARAMARKPAMMLLDEPFSALDTGLRTATRQAIAEILTASQTTAVLVTHDQAEALSFANEVAVMREGRLVQVGAPIVVYTRPRDLGVANLLGDTIILDAMLEGSLASCALGVVPVRRPTVQGRVKLLLRPEQVHVVVDSPIRATVEGAVYFGPESTVRLRVEPHADADPRFVDEPTVITIRHWNAALGRAGAQIALRVVGEGVAFPADPVA